MSRSDEHGPNTEQSNGFEAWMVDVLAGSGISSEDFDRVVSGAARRRAEVSLREGWACGMAALDADHEWKE